MIQGTNNGPLGTPIAAPSRVEKIPSMAQFAMNQTLHKGKQKPAEPLTQPQQNSGIINDKTTSMSIFKDNSSGQFVTIFRDPVTGDVVEQIPEKRVIAFYSDLEQKMQKPDIQPPSMDIKT